MDQASIEELDQALDRVPILAHVHPLVPLCLSRPTHIVRDADELLRGLDDPTPQACRRLLILSDDSRLRVRFPSMSSVGPPSAEQINAAFSGNLGYARHNLLTTHQVSAHIDRQVRERDPDTVVLILVDGLGYGDVLGWPCSVRPCFVDGPSITFTYADRAQGELAVDVGFPAIVGRPSVFSRLYSQGYHSARGYTYWDRDNLVSDYLFSGVPAERVTSSEDTLDRIAQLDDLRGSYIQIMREGLDGLAHGKREVRPLEVEALVAGLLADVMCLSQLLARKGSRAMIFLTADHGILWRTEHQFRMLPESGTRHPRYASAPPQSTYERSLMTLVAGDGWRYWLLHYPCLGTPIRANDSGTHGGLSYQESIVPFATFEVTPVCN